VILEGRKLQDIEVRHMAVARGPADDCVVWWYGAVLRNNRDRTLPLAVVWFRKLLHNGAFGPPFHVDVGITELALVQVGTIWNRGVCRSQLALEEREIEVDFSKPGWRYESQLRVHDRRDAELISSAAYPLPFGNRDRSEVLVFSLRRGGELVVPTLEFFSRCYGRSAEVNRILSTYPWSDAEPRLHVPLSHPVPPGYWSVGLPMRIINDDAMFVAHVKYDAYARAAAKSVHSNLQSQFTSLGGKAFPKIGPWFTGPATLIVQGIPLSNDRFYEDCLVKARPSRWNLRAASNRDAHAGLLQS
jgi:hypothetical protein